LTEWIENLLAALVSLRAFGVALYAAERLFPQGHLPFTARAFSRAPHLEYMTIYDKEDHYWKRDRGECVPCDEAGFSYASAACS
jgi:hypothetical protein